MDYTTEQVREYIASLGYYESVIFAGEDKGDCMYFNAVSKEGYEATIRADIEADIDIQEWNIYECSEGWDWSLINLIYEKNEQERENTELSVGKTGYIMKKGYIEECIIHAIHELSYTVKSSYYTFDVRKNDMYATREAAEVALRSVREQKLERYLNQMENKDDFIEFCIQQTYHNAHNPEDYDRELILALKQQYKAFFGKELDEHND